MSAPNETPDVAALADALQALTFDSQLSADDLVTVLATCTVLRRLAARATTPESGT
jgi:hypothetical protein